MIKWDFAALIGKKLDQILALKVADPNTDEQLEPQKHIKAVFVMLKEHDPNYMHIQENVLMF